MTVYICLKWVLLQFRRAPKNVKTATYTHQISHRMCVTDLQHIFYTVCYLLKCTHLCACTLFLSQETAVCGATGCLFVYPPRTNACKHLVKGTFNLTLYLTIILNLNLLPHENNNLHRTLKYNCASYPCFL